MCAPTWSWTRDDSTLYAAFRNNATGTDAATAGVWRYKGGVWKKIKQQVASVTDAKGNTVSNPPARIAVNARKIVLNYECYIYINSLSNIENLSGSPLESSWPASPPRGCDGPTNNRNFGLGSQNGAVLSLAISPTDDNRIIAGASDAQLTTDGGTTWSRINSTGYDYHQIVFQNGSNDSNAFLAADPARAFRPTRGWPGKRPRRSASWSMGRPPSNITT